MEQIDKGRLLNYIDEKIIYKNTDLSIYEFNINRRIYAYGAQKRINYDCNNSRIKEVLKDYVRELICYKQRFLSSRKRGENRKTFLSSAYFGLNRHLNSLGYNTQTPPWALSKDVIHDVRYIHNYYSFRRKSFMMSFQDLLGEIGIELINKSTLMTKEMIQRNNINAVIAHSTHTTENRLVLEGAQMAGIPRFVFLHGLPFPFYYEESDRTDYLVVWSDKIKDNYVKLAKFPASRIYVSGHPVMTNFSHSSFKFDLNNILVISPSTESEWCSDRGNMIWFLMQIKEVLLKFGIKKVRFRPHPHETPTWYYRFIDRDFFVIDERPIINAIKDSSLIIGTISTVLLESLYYGVNYIVYEPINEYGLNIYGHHPVPPFDGSDNYLPVARDMGDIEHIIKTKQQVDPKFFAEYIQTPFDISFIKRLI